MIFAGTYDQDNDDDEYDDYGPNRGDGPDGLDAEPRGCVLGARCLAHDPFHTSDECFDTQMAEAFYGREPSVRKPLPPTGRQRTRAIWRKRGRR